MGRRGRWAAVLVVLLLAFWLRFHLLEAQSFWNDEGNSARLSERSLAHIIEGTASDIHPPLYYVLLHGWRKLVGQTEFGLRSLSAFAGVLMAPLTFVLGQLVAGKRPFAVGWLAALGTATSPALVYYSQEARMYALLGLWSVLSTWLLLVWLQTVTRKTLVVDRKTSVVAREASVGQRPTTDDRRLMNVFRVAFGNGWGLAYALCVAVGLYTHYFFPAVLVLHNLLFLLFLAATYMKLEFGFTPSPHHLVTLSPLHPIIPAWIILMLTTLLLYLPWLPTFLVQFGSDDLVRGGIGTFLSEAMQWQVLGGTYPAVTWLPWLVGLLVLLAGWHGRWRALIPLLGAAVPLLFMVIAGTMEPVYFKFLAAAAPFTAVLLGMAVFSGKWRGTQLLALPGVLILAVFTAQSLKNMYTDPVYARADYRTIAARILADDHPNVGVILNAPNQWEVFTYYFPQEELVYPLPKGRSRPDPDQVEATLTDIVARHERLYALFWGDAQRDPERLIERWLDEHAFKATETWVGDVRLVMYAAPETAATEMETAVALPFGEQITLQGYTLSEKAIRAGDVLQITLFWKTAVSLDKRYKVFLHLVDETGTVVAQRDSEPGGGLALTSVWEPGDTIVDNHGVLIPADLTAGSYTLLLGLYDVADPAARLRVKVNGEQMNAYQVTHITVVE